jgi:hypothetical protein
MIPNCFVIFGIATSAVAARVASEVQSIGASAVPGVEKVGVGGRMDSAACCGSVYPFEARARAGARRDLGERVVVDDKIIVATTLSIDDDRRGDRDTTIDAITNKT